VELTLQQQKAQLRQRVKAQLAGLSEELRRDSSAQARALLSRQQAWQQAGCILFYAPTHEEINLWPLAEEAVKVGKMVALPRYDVAADSYEACRVTDMQQELRIGRYGLREPLEDCPVVPLNRLDFVLVPGVAFELHGRRLGRGKGYYDRLLAAAGGKTCGVAFDEQIVERIPVEPHDSDVNCILTPTRWIEL
jgi:5-formyltetrahydrofolate cyclo-ligase